MNAVPDEVIDSLKTDLKQVLYFRKYADNLARLNELLNRENSIFENVAWDAAELLSELTNTPIRLPKYKGGTVNMCEAVRQMCEDAAREAVIKAKAESEEALKKVKKETEKEAVRNSFALLSGFNPDLCSDDIVNAIAKQYKLTPSAVRKILNS